MDKKPTNSDLCKDSTGTDEATSSPTFISGTPQTSRQHQQRTVSSKMKTITEPLRVSSRLKSKEIMVTKEKPAQQFRRSERNINSSVEYVDWYPSCESDSETLTAVSDNPITPEEDKKKEDAETEETKIVPEKTVKTSGKQPKYTGTKPKQENKKELMIYPTRHSQRKSETKQETQEEEQNKDENTEETDAEKRTKTQTEKEIPKSKEGDKNNRSASKPTDKGGGKSKDTDSKGAGVASKEIDKKPIPDIKKITPEKSTGKANETQPQEEESANASRSNPEIRRKTQDLERTK